MLDENIPLVSAAERDNNIDEDPKNQSEENGSTLRLVIPPLIIFATVVTILTFIAVVFVIARDSPSAHYRTDCYPDALSKFSNYSKEACRNRHCLFDERANLSGTQCYMNDNYGYLFEGAEKTQNGIQIKLKRTQALLSMFPEPIDNVILDVQYYTNDIIRFKLYDSDNQRYE
ncbi:unnamed protein product, partial [Adineta steineri]